MTKKIKSVLYVLTYIACYLIAQALAMVVPPAYHTLKTKGNTDDFLYYVYSMAERNTLYLSVAAALITVLLFIIILKIRKIKISSYIHTKALTVKHIAAAVFLAYGVMTVSALIAMIPAREPYLEGYNENVGFILNGNLWFVFAIVGIAAPIFEEIMYRGIILSELRKGFGFFFANLLQAVLFGVMHLNVIQGIYAGIVGFVLGYAYKMSGTIYLTVLIHFLFNATNVLLSGIAVSGGLTVSAGAAAVSFLLGFLLLKNNK